jgi:caffeoyl-CoA O-methyltransferase
MKGTPLTDQIVDYMTRLFPAEDQLLEDLRRDAEAAGIPPIQISAEQGAFMQVLLRSVDARSVIEVGTLGGYSAIMMARALPADGQVVTIERDPLRAEFARNHIARAGLDGKIRVVVGSGVDVLERELAGSGPYDFAFIDADKPSYVRYLELIYPMIRPGGLIAGDNALAWGKIADDTDDPDVKGMQAFNRAMADHPGLQSSIVPVGDGMCLGWKRTGE